VRNWATQSKMGVTTNQAKRVQNRPSRTNVHKEDREFMVNFLDKLPKLPSHYYLKATNNLYLEETFKTVSDVYNLYKNQCEESSLKNMSLTSFMKAIDEKNIGVFTLRKDRCDLCEKYNIKI
jgi:phage/plasmid-associated DNA primase